MAPPKSAIPVKRNSSNPPRVPAKSPKGNTSSRSRYNLTRCADQLHPLQPKKKSSISDQRQLENLHNNNISAISTQLEDESTNGNLSVSSSQPHSNSTICRSEVSLRRTASIVNAPINIIKDKTLKRIFSYLNYSDLVQCRAVKRHWKHFISKDEQFLSRTVFVVNIQKTYNVKTDTIAYNDLLQWAELPFRHARIQFIDYLFFKEPQYFAFYNSDNDKYFPKERFLGSLASLEIRSSYLLWSTLKRILIKAVLLEKLKISNCHVSEDIIPNKVDSEFEEFAAGNTVFAMKALEIHETRTLKTITLLLKKFTGFQNQSLKTLKIAYYPPVVKNNASSESKSEESEDFCRELKTLLSLCANSLETLVLDIQHETTLDLVGYHISKELEGLGSKLNLKEFQLSPSFGVWLNKPELCPKFQVAMTMRRIGVEAEKNMKMAATSLARFLETQKNLKKLGFPCLEYPEAFSACFKSVLQRLRCAASLEALAVPCAGFLPEDFFHRFSSLKSLKVGVSCCGDVTSFWNAFDQYNLEQSNSSLKSEWELSAISQSETKTQPIIKNENDVSREKSLDALKNIEALCLSTVESPDNFSLLVEKMTNLTSLEVNSGPDTPVLHDEDIQVCIKYLKSLKSLVVARSENFTDYGITGIPEHLCQLLFKHQKYHKDGINQKIWTAPIVKGRPLSDLKGLRKLVLMGRCAFTDIGIGYGLGFNELKYCHLPYSDTVTSWGIERLGKMNPSIESLLFSGINQMMKRAFLQLKNTHERIKNGDTTRSGYFWEQKSPFVDDFELILPTPEEIVTILMKVFATKVHTLSAALRSLQAHPDNNVNE